MKLYSNNDWIFTNIHQTLKHDTRCQRDGAEVVDEIRERLLKKESLDYHESLPHGKIKVVPTKPHATAY